MNKPMLLYACYVCTLYLAGCRSMLVPSKSLLDRHQLAIQSFDGKYLTLSGPVRYEDDAQRITLHTQLRMQKDSLIWCSISALGREVVRGLITPYDIRVLNRLQKTYTVYDYDTLCKILNFRIDYPCIQALLLGYPPFWPSKSHQIQRTTDYLIIHQTLEKGVVENVIQRDLMQLVQLNIQTAHPLGSLRLAYGNFKKLQDYIFAHYRSIQFVLPKAQAMWKGTITIKNLKASSSAKPLQFPFSIPKKYAQ